MKNADESQGCRKFSRIHELLLKIYLKLQLHSKTTKQVERKEGMNME